MLGRRRRRLGRRRRRLGRRRRKMRVHPVNVKRLEFGMFSHLWPDLLEMFR
jgi:hypothetical protein